ncbi:hypothetical protein [Nocardia asteroides]|uniref:hypothetical protein n=1 Tax=Nocardia asteroides TaxID=1824 RepID=UPI001E28A2DC|nr:hypothetical protein [Nocardia asteroides]UGT57632.1 hypothetical protein LTT85_12655 [Nocardia asteroides]
MLITAVTDLVPGVRGIVRSSTGEWPAVWRGRGIVRSGKSCDVELEVDDDSSELHIVQDDSPSGDAPPKGISVLEGRLIVCGTLLVFDDGAAALDLEPGIVLLDSRLPAPDSDSARRAFISPVQIQIFPTNI